MMRIKTALVLLLAVLSTATLCAAEDESRIEAQVLEFFSEKLRVAAEARGLSFDERLGMYVVRLMARTGSRKIPVAAYVTGNGKVLILGRAYDMKTGRILTREHLAGLRPERLRLDIAAFRRGPFLGRGPEKLTFIGGPRCPHCRKAFPEVLRLVREHPDRFSLAYVGYPAFTPPEAQRAIECLRREGGDRFWQVLERLYRERDHRKVLQEVDLTNCPARTETKAPPVDGVPVLVLGSGETWEGSTEIIEFVQRASRGEGN